MWEGGRSERMNNADFVAGASASLKKTIDEVMWRRKGFNRGHRESRRQTARGEAPKILRYGATRLFFKGGKRTVHLKSVPP